MAKNPNGMSSLDFPQVIKTVYDPNTDRLRVDAEVTANISGAQEVIISDVDDSIKIGNGSGVFADVNSGRALKVSSGLVKVFFDNFTGAFTSTTSTYTYKSGLTTVATVTVTYTDTTKNEILSLVVS